MLSRDLDQFYTKSSISKNCLDITLSIVKSKSIFFDLWLEPSAGTGSFYSILPNNKIGIDLEPKHPNIIKYNFLEYNLSDKTYITIGNPPFGKNSSLAIKFFNKAAQNSALIAFIVPKTFKKESVINKLDNNFHLIHEHSLPDFSFEYLNEDYNVPCVFQVWEKSNLLREKFNSTKVHPDFSFVTKDKADFAIQRVGANAGRIKDNFTSCSPSSHYFIKASDDVKNNFLNINWDAVKFNTAGNPSISKSELISLYVKLSLHN